MIKIEINCTPEDLDGHIAALGFMRNPVAALGQKANPLRAPEAQHVEDNPYISKSAVGSGFVATPIVEKIISNDGQLETTVIDGVVSAITVTNRGASSALATEMEAHERPSDLAAPPQDTNAKRVPGQPAPGRKRRTKEEMEEDYAYLKRHGSMPAGAEATFAQAGPSPAISTGAERIDPATAAQDEADEAAETAMRATDKPTMEDLQRAVAKWIEKIGSTAVIKDLRSIIGCAMIELPEAEIGAAIGRVEAAIGGSTVLGVPNLNGQPPAPEEAEIIETPKADKDDVVTALKAYGQRYDGSVDTNAMPITKEDMPKLFGEIFGVGVTGIGSMPKTTEAYGRITAAIAAATRDNPFRRQVHA